MEKICCFGGVDTLEGTGKPYYRLFDHTADLGMEISGEDPAGLFVNAGRALFDAMVCRQEGAQRKIHRRALTVEGYDWPDLMVNWLRELLHIWHGHRQIPVRIQIASIFDSLLKAEVTTGDYLPAEDQVKKEIKAVTYHQIAVGPREDGSWRARVILDV